MKISKELKKNGKATFKGPKVKERKAFAPPTKVEKSAKNYDRKKETFDEDEQYGEVPLKKDKKSTITNRRVDFGDDMEVPLKDGSTRKRKPLEGTRKKNRPWKDSKNFSESVSISKFIESVLTKNYSDADKYLKQVVGAKIQEKIQQELNNPLF